MAQSIGERIKDLRQRRGGLSQADLARAVGVTPSYMSLVEAGQRFPRQGLLRDVAAFFGVPLEYLVTGNAGAERLQIDVDFAEMALRNGDPAAALAQFAAIEQHASPLIHGPVRRQAQWGRARALERLGKYDESLPVLLELAEAPDLPPAVGRTAVITEHCYVLLKQGEFTRAIEVGAPELERLRDQGRNAELKGVAAKGFSELASTLVGCYRELGQLETAQQLAAEAIAVAESRGSLRDRGAAYWQAATVAKERGDLPAARALNERAQALYSEDDNARAVASLKINAAHFALADDKPDAERIVDDLKQALAYLEAEEGSAVEIAEALRALASAHLAQNNVDAAWKAISRALACVPTGAVVERAHILKVRADIERARGADEAALVQAYVEAADVLADVNLERETRTILRAVAEELDAAGAHSQANRVWRRLANA